MALDLTTMLGSNLGQVFKDVVGSFKCDPTVKAQLQSVLDQNADIIQQKQLDLEGKLIDQNVQLNSISGQNIRADATSSDHFTSRARPLFMYIIEAILAFNYIGIPVARICGSRVDSIILPGDLLTLFGVCVTGYVYARSMDKALELPGASSVNGLSFKNTSPAQSTL